MFNDAWVNSLILWSSRTARQRAMEQSRQIARGATFPAIQSTPVSL
jgi:hypothetical protein